MARVREWDHHYHYQFVAAPVNVENPANKPSAPPEGLKLTNSTHSFWQNKSFDLLRDGSETEASGKKFVRTTVTPRQLFQTQLDIPVPSPRSTETYAP